MTQYLFNLLGADIWIGLAGLLGALVAYFSGMATGVKKAEGKQAIKELKQQEQINETIRDANNAGRAGLVRKDKYNRNPKR